MGSPTSISRVPHERDFPLPGAGPDEPAVERALVEHPIWLWPNLLSLDAPLIAVLWLHLFAASEHVELAPSVSVVLALTVWVIYVADRLFDGFGTNPMSHRSARHQFHRDHRNVLLPLLTAVLALISWSCTQLDARTLHMGMLLTLVVSGYFGAVHWVGPTWKFPKEAVVALLFGVGTYFPVWIHVQRLTMGMAISLALFVMVCWLNTVFIDYAEWSGGANRSEATHASTLGSAGAHLSAIAIAAAVTAGAILLVVPSRVESPVALAVILSAAALAALCLYRRRLSLNAVRVLADAALLTPVLVLLFKPR